MQLRTFLQLLTTALKRYVNINMTDIIERIMDGSQWPCFENPEHLSGLDTLANNANGLDTIEGYLAALAIYHQLCDEMARLLLEDSRFYIQLSCYPAKIDFPRPKKQMAGQILSQLDFAIDFEGKNEFVNKCRMMNSLRNSVFHNLTNQPDLLDLKIQLSRISSIYDEIFLIYENSHDWFYVCFKDFRKDVFVDLVECDDT